MFSFQAGVRFDATAGDESSNSEPRTSSAKHGTSPKVGLKKSPLKGGGKGFGKLKGGSKLMEKFKHAATKVKTSSDFLEKSRANLVIDDSSSSEDSDEDDVGLDAKQMQNAELPQEFWQVQKLIRYLKIGNQTATIIALCNLVDFDLRKDHVQFAIMDSGGLEVLTNLLDTDDPKCQLGSLKILKEITCHPDIRRQITLMGGIEPTIVILSDPYKELQLLATETLANLTQFRKARNTFRRQGGIPRLVDLLDVEPAKYGDLERVSEQDLPLPVKVARGTSYALWSLAKSKKNKMYIQKAGGLSLLVKLVRTKNISVIIPAIGTLQVST